MKLTALLIFLLFFIRIHECVDDGLLSNLRRRDLKQDIPVLFQRIYKEWSGKTGCINESLKSSTAEIKQRGPLKYAIKARIAKHGDKPVARVELWLELRNIPKDVLSSNQTFIAVMRPLDSRIESQRQTSNVSLAHGNLLEVSFNATEIYLASKTLDKKYVHFRMFLQPSSQRGKESLHGARIRAFLIIYEFIGSCSDEEPHLKGSFQFPETQTHTNRILRATKSSSTLMKSAFNARERKETCSLEDQYVSFDTIGWDKFVIAPSGVWTNICSGTCPFPLPSDLNYTAHALLQSYVYHTTGESGPAQCIPQTMDPLTMVLHDMADDMYFIMHYPKMIARSCTCR